MNTFLPYEDFKESAKVLDYRRLGKQRVEAWQIYLTLIKIRMRNAGVVLNWNPAINPLNKKIAWENHPIVKMWKGYESCLLRYTLRIIEEWKRRGYKDNMYEKVFQAMQKEDLKYPPNSKVPFPEWIGNEKLHASHRSNLLRKDFEYYSKFGWTESSTLPYFWFV